MLLEVPVAAADDDEDGLVLTDALELVDPLESTSAPGPADAEPLADSIGAAVAAARVAADLADWSTRCAGPSVIVVPQTVAWIVR